MHAGNFRDLIKQSFALNKITKITADEYIKSVCYQKECHGNLRKDLIYKSEIAFSFIILLLNLKSVKF